MAVRFFQVFLLYPKPLREAEAETASLLLRSITADGSDLCQVGIAPAENYRLPGDTSKLPKSGSSRQTSISDDHMA